MASTYSDLKIELIGTGEQTGTWGNTTNNNFSIAVGEAITGTADVAFSSADVTVTLTNTNASQAARNLRLNLTGTSGGARQLILGSGCQIEKLYLVNNGLADAVTVKNTTGTGIVVPAGKSMFVYNNGTNVVDAITYLSAIGTGVFDAGTVSAPSITFTGDTNTGIYSPAADTIAFTEGGVESMRIDSSGNVGIGTNSPTSKLDVVGTVRLINTITPANISLIADLGGLSLQSLNSNPMYFNTGGSERMRIDSSGNLNIGTTGFTATRVVNQGAYGVFRSAGGTTASPVTDRALAYVQANNQVYANISFLNTITSDNATWMTFNVTPQGSTTPFEAMRVNFDGFVGIGTSSPSAQLDANISNPTRGIVARVRNSATSSQTGAQLLFTQNTIEDWVIGQPAGVNAFAFWSARNAAVDGNERMRIDSSGNLGIGTSSPAQRLQVQGGFFVAGAATLAPAVGGGLFSFESPVFRYYVGDGTGYSFRFSRRASSTTTDLMTITDTGNVGIGTSSPSTRLHVAGGSATELRITTSDSLASTGAALVRFGGSNSATSGYVGFGGTANDYYNWNALSGASIFGTANTERMRITDVGNVGIGNNNPTIFSGLTTLSIGGSNRGLITVRNASNADRGYVYFDGTNFSVESVGAPLNLVSPTSQPIIFTTVGTERMRILNTGNILCLAGGSTTTTGTGITFPATQFASSDANTLDDYEEGNWTPTSGTANVSLSLFGNAVYVKIGRQVTVYFYASFDNSSGGTIAGIRINGLPFTSSGYGQAISYYNPNISNVAYGGYTEASQTYINSSVSLTTGVNGIMINAVYFV